MYRQTMNGKYNLKMDKDVKTYVFFNKPGKNIMKQFLKYDDAETNKYKDISEYIMQLITKSEFLCKGLTHSYVKKTFARVDAVVVIGSSMNILPNGNIYGFALIEFDIKNDSVHIDVICSHYGVRGAGEKLIKEVEIICNKVHLNQIYLTSVDTAITFYEKYGFVKNRKHCVDMCLMTKVLKKSSSKSPKSPKSPRSPKIPKSPRNKKKTQKKPVRETSPIVISDETSPINISSSSSAPTISTSDSTISSLPPLSSSSPLSSDSPMSSSTLSSMSPISSSSSSPSPQRRVVPKSPRKRIATKTKKNKK